MSYTLPLSRIFAHDLNLIGGKGANLGEMFQAGFPVPPGFCITTEAYKEVISGGNLYPQIEKLLQKSTSSAEKAQEIQALVLNASLSGDLVAEILNAYRELVKDNDVAVAVRSSATAEDLPQASFAGQQETYLGVRGEDDLLHYTQLCWASLWTERAISYRERNNFPHQQVALAVIVQVMVAPDTAGVLFTANPLNGKKDEMLVNASYGLGESVVSGQITPDSYRLSAEGEPFVVEQKVGTKEMRIDMQPSGGTCTTPVSEAAQNRLSLDSVQLGELSALGLKVQAHYAAPQDIEWAFVGRDLFLLQTRPITFLNKELVQRLGKLSGVEHRILDDILEHYPDPPFPLDYFAVTDGYDQVQDAFRMAGMKVEKADRIIRMAADGVPYVEPSVPKLSLKMLRLPLTIYKKMQINPDDWKAENLFFAERIAALKAGALQEKSNEALARFIADAVQTGTEVGTLRFGKYIVPMMLRGAILIRWVKIATKDKSLIEADLLGELDYKTALIDRALEELADEAGKDDVVRSALVELPPDEVVSALRKDGEGVQFLRKLNSFLEEHGARTMKAYLPFSNFSWAEKPENLIAVLPLLLRSNGKKDKAEQKYSVLREKTMASTPTFLRNSFLRMLTRYRHGHIAREATLYMIEEAFSLARQGTQEAARRFLSAGVIADKEDILFLTLPELYDVLRGDLLPEKVQELLLVRREARPKADAVWQDRGIVGNRYSADALQGQSGSPGVVQGMVRVISGPGEFHKLVEGDVLVCQFTDPTWTPLFGLASAVVADTGGALSHAAIVAREYGIPAVLGTQVATKKLRDGMLVRVDGNQGMVFIE